MKITIEIDLDRVEGRNLSAAVVAEHLIERLMEGELPADPGYIFPEGSHYKLRAARMVEAA